MQNKRLFTFGCSFTNYIWPTWADIMAQEFDHFENWGRVGGGNHFILYSLIEAMHRNNIGKDDVVAVMFTSIGREDRWIKGQWLTPGSVYTSSMLPEYIEKFTDPDGYLITNSAVQATVIQLLQSLGCQYFVFSTVPTAMVDDSYLRNILPFKNNIEKEVSRLYKKELEQIKPSVYEVVFDNDWHSRDDVLIRCNLSTFVTHLDKRYNECAGADWPSFEKFWSNDLTTTSPDIIKEIAQQFDFFAWRNSLLTQRQDCHPTPWEHKEYLEKLDFDLSDKQKDFARHWNHKVINDSSIDWHQPTINRF